MRTTSPMSVALVAWLAASPAAAGTFVRGVDVSSLPAVEAGSGVFLEDGAPVDALAILKARGLDAVRIRLWHTPTGGGSGLDETLALAERATAAGFGVLLDLHYSDTWADPGHQTVPAAWAGLDLPALADSVRDYTRGTLLAFAARGVVPRGVQIGNEITAGMLWNVGRVGGVWDTAAQWDHLATLIEAGIAGVDEALPGALRPEIMVHTDRGGDNAGARWFFDMLASRQVDFDLIGVSYYPWWHGTLEALDANLNDLAARYGKSVVVVETAYPWTLGWFDDTHNLVGLESQLLPGYPATPAGQAAFLAALLAIVREVPDGRGGGVYWWEPAWITSPGQGSPWENLALFDETGRPLPALAAFGAAADAGGSLPRTGLRLEPCRPNPFNPRTNLRYALPEGGNVDLAIYNARGERVRCLVSGPMESGAHSVAWDGVDLRGRGVASGVYVARLSVGATSLSRQLVLLR